MQKGTLKGLKTYSDDNVTLDDFVERLRADKRLRGYFKAWIMFIYVELSNTGSLNLDKLK